MMPCDDNDYLATALIFFVFYFLFCFVLFLFVCFFPVSLNFSSRGFLFI